MKSHDRYGFAEKDLGAVRLAVEQVLGIRMVARESLYMGGEYYEHRSLDGERFVLKLNVDLLDNEPVELRFPEMGVLLDVEGTTQSEALTEKLLQAGTKGQLLWGKHSD